MKNVLIVEDHTDLAHLIQMNLSELECNVVHARNGQDGLDQALAQAFDLIILDIMLPQKDGLEICRELRSQQNYTPIMMLTSKSAELDRVMGLEMGADDYITKPFSLREFVARVKAMFRRLEQYSPDQQPDSHCLCLGDLSVDKDMRKVSVGARSVNLTAKEYDLLLHFIEHPGRVFTRSQLLDQVWGYGHEGYEHTVNSHINRLRGKLEDNPAHPHYILTVWGVGYKFNETFDLHT